MAITYPTTLDTFTNPLGTDATSASIGNRTHSQFHGDANDALEALQVKVGINSSTVVTSLDHIASNNELFIGYRSSSNQSITKDSWTKVQINTEEVDVSGRFDSSTNYRYTVVVPGTYLVIGAVTYLSTDVVDGGTYLVNIYKNGSASSQNRQHAATADFCNSITARVYNGIVADDYFELFTTHTAASTNPSNIVTGSHLTFFIVARLHGVTS